jgi:signal transduction histidine kinase
MAPLSGVKTRTALWIGTAAVVVPLAVLLVFQYRWLVSLQETTALAQEHTLSNYLEAVTSEVHYHYARLGERALNLPLSLFDGRELDLDAALHHLQQRKLYGVQWVFLVREDPVGQAGVVFYDPQCACWAEPPPAQVKAVHVAASPWVMLAQQRTILESGGLHVDERDPAARMVLNPILDARRRVAGMAGMVLDPDHFRQQVLPAAIEKSLPQFFQDAPLTHFVVQVADGGGEVKYSTDCPEAAARVDDDGAGSLAATKPFSFVFRDWGIAVQSHGPTAEELARSHFLVNLALSAMLGIVLVGGTVFTLRTASREMRLSQMKSDFISNVSHELRTPLASIQAFGELLRRGRVQDADKAAQYGGFIETESRRLSQLINNVLDFSKLESGTHAYRFERAELPELIAEALAPVELRAREAGFELSYQNRASGPMPVDVDRQALEQALGNLLDNAMKYSGDSRNIRVWLDRDGARARIGVRDFGIGIARDEQEKIFERFHRVSSGLVHDVRGTGLGLSIVQEIAAAHRGSVAVTSEPGRGSTFVLTLPIVSEEAAGAHRSSVRAAYERAPVGERPSAKPQGGTA